jgi:carboxylate-amine ligase
VNYGSSAPFTLGVEEELQLLNAETYDLTSRYEEVFGEAEAADSRIRPELMQSTVEVATEPVHEAAGESLLGVVRRLCELTTEGL